MQAKSIKLKTLLLQHGLVHCGTLTKNEVCFMLRLAEEPKVRHEMQCKYLHFRICDIA
jgi:hypothetical protein